LPTTLSRVTAAFIESYFGASERFQKIRDTLDPALLSSYLAALPEVMQDVLGAVDDEYGSPRQYLLDLPGGVQILENLERKLLG